MKPVADEKAVFGLPKAELQPRRHEPRSRLRRGFFQRPALGETGTDTLRKRADIAEANQSGTIVT